MSALTAAGGVFGYLRARSIPSLVGGLAVSSLYGTGVRLFNLLSIIGLLQAQDTMPHLQGYLISQNKDGGFATSAGQYWFPSTSTRL